MDLGLPSEEPFRAYYERLRGEEESQRSQKSEERDLEHSRSRIESLGST